MQNVIIGSLKVQLHSTYLRVDEAVEFGFHRLQKILLTNELHSIAS